MSVKYTHICSVLGFHLKNADSNSNIKKREEKIFMFDVVTFALHAVVLEGAVLQVTCLRFGSIVTFSELVSHIMGA